MGLERVAYHAPIDGAVNIYPKKPINKGANKEAASLFLFIIIINAPDGIFSFAEGVCFSRVFEFTGYSLVYEKPPVLPDILFIVDLYSTHHFQCDNRKSGILPVDKFETCALTGLDDGSICIELMINAFKYE